MRQIGPESGNGDAGSLTAPPKSAVFTILVIEGNASFVGFLEEFFKTEGHYIVRAASADEAMAKTFEYKPDLILLDNQVAGIDAMTLLPELLMEHASAAVIVMAGRPSISEAVEVMRLGAVDYLARPLDPKKLKRAIDTQKALFGEPLLAPAGAL